MRDLWHIWHDNVGNSNCTYLIVENIPSCFPHCGIINVSSKKLSTFLIIWINFSTFLQLNQKIHGDFHKSFRNLSNFFREHARGARAIFYLCPCAVLFLTKLHGTEGNNQGWSLSLDLRFGLNSHTFIYRVWSIANLTNINCLFI